jgi:uncharacterized protein (DUF3820 family)
MVTHVGYSVGGRSRGRVTLCAVCTVHVEKTSMSFLVEPQSQGRRFITDLASKQLRWFVSGLASKLLGRFFRFGLKIDGDGFSRFDLKTSGSGFLIWASKSAASV